MANQVDLIFKESDLLLNKLNNTKLQDIVGFLCSVKKNRGYLLKTQSGRNKKTRERIVKVELVWTKYFASSR